jgi:poly-gamma-glutamate capsule biosynthesis protein CapA/YwtB (metallophosphatase superfamily)
MTVGLAVAGDAILNRRVNRIRDQGFCALVDRIRAADAAFVNLELSTPRAPYAPSIKGHGIYISAAPSAIDDLQWMGFSLYSNANNHALDYSQSGMLDTIAELDARVLVHAGGGASLAEARRPAYFDAPAGRLALIAATTTWSDRYLAADPAGRIGGRAGVNPLRYTTEHGVADQDLEVLRRIKSRLHGTPLESGDQPLRFVDQTFRSDIPPGVATALNETDMGALVRSVKEAAQQADSVVVSLHFHEGPGGTMNTEAPAAHITEAAHRLIDAGAAAILGHGPHRPHGVELYRGRPILYSLGNLFFMLETIAVLPPECFEAEGLPPDSNVAEYSSTAVHRILYTPPMWDGVLAMLRLDRGGGAAEVELLPFDLGLDRSDSMRGVPVLAGGDRGRAILDSVVGLSEPFGTAIRVEERDGGMVGVAGA